MKKPKHRISFRNTIEAAAKIEAVFRQIAIFAKRFFNENVIFRRTHCSINQSINEFRVVKVCSNSNEVFASLFKTISLMKKPKHRISFRNTIEAPA